MGKAQMRKKGGMRRKAAIKGSNVQDEEKAIDRMKQLPDDILISIISRLPLREATATSLISSRWRHLYTYTTHLKLPSFEPHIGCFDQYLEQVQDHQFPSYVQMVNRILDSYMRCQVLKEFHVRMPFFEGADIGRWLQFAFTRKVQVLDIDIYGMSTYKKTARMGYYTLGLSNLIINTGGHLSLKRLSLAYIHVDDDELKFLVSNSPFLESLSISHSNRLRNVLIVGGRRVLKHLHISDSRRVESIEVRDMINLVSLRCFHLPSTYVLKLCNVPKLSDFSMSTQNQNLVADFLVSIPSCIHDQLQHLKLQTITGYTYTGFTELQPNLPTHMPELVNVKHLKLRVYICDRDLSALFPLIKACRSLETVEIKFLWQEGDRTKIEGGEIIRPPKEKLSPNLRKLKVSGYRGSNKELEFAVFIMHNVVALEELIVEPCDEPRRIRRAATARAYQQFPPLKPNSAKLIII